MLDKLLSLPLLNTVCYVSKHGLSYESGLKEEESARDTLEEQLKSAHMDYYLAKGSAKLTRASYLLTLAEACAYQNNLKKVSVYKSLVQRERQRKAGRKIKFLRGKGIVGSTTIIQVQGENGSWNDVTDKHTMEQELMASTRRKYTASFHTPFMTPPLVNELGYLATSKAAEEILEGTYRPPKGVDPYTKQLIHQLQRPVLAELQSDHLTALPLTTYQNFWRKAKERTYCFPGSPSRNVPLMIHWQNLSVS